MAAPSAYTEQQLKQFMLKAVGNIGTVLELTADDFDEAVNDALLVYDTDSIASATDIPKVRALARVEAWKVAVNKAAGLYDFTSHDGQYKRSTIHAQALAGLALAREDAAPYVGDETGYVVGVSKMRYTADPYVLVAEDDDVE